MDRPLLYSEGFLEKLFVLVLSKLSPSVNDGILYRTGTSGYALAPRIMQQLAPFEVQVLRHNGLSVQSDNQHVLDT